MIKAIKKYRYPYLFVAVPILWLCIFIIYPLMGTVALSFTDWNGIEPPRFIGFDNYVALAQDSGFRKSVVNTLWFAIESLVGGVGLALLTALALSEKIKLKGFFQAVFFMPVVINLVALGFLWKLIFNANGPLNYLIQAIGMNSVNWLGDPDFAMHAIITMSIWAGFGYSMVLFYTALLNIPAELYEAASIDGANTLERFVNVTVPGLRNTLVFISITGVAGALSVFTQIFVMTNGGPFRQTETVMFYLYSQFQSLNLGYANAIGLSLFAVLLIFSVVNLRFGEDY